MEYTRTIQRFGAASSREEVARTLDRIAPQVAANCRADIYRRCFGALDLTSLNPNDTRQRIEALTRKTVEFSRHFPNLPRVASLCVFPAFVETVGLAAGDSPLTITSVAGGFPSSQTYLEVKMLEAAMAVENGADEVDVVISVGEILSGEYDLAGGELEMLRGELDEEIVLKVILESGLLDTPDTIRRAALIAMQAGADFIKTSTGKTGVSATPEAAVVMCEAIRVYWKDTGRRVGFKAAGGVSTPEQAALYYTVVEQILGEEWLDPSLFRIGASSLANRLLSAIQGEPIAYF